MPDKMPDIFELGAGGLQAVEEKLELVDSSARKILGLKSCKAPTLSGLPEDGKVCFITNTAEETKALNINGGGKDEGADIIAWPFGRAANERWILTPSHHPERKVHNVFEILSPYSKANIGVKEEADRPNGIKLVNSATPALFAFEHVRKHETKTTHLYRIKVLGHTKNCAFTSSVYLTSLPGADKNLNLLEAEADNNHQLWEVEPEIPDAAEQTSAHSFLK